MIISGLIKNTYVFYTSDHGYHLGQFGLIKGKAFPFEFDTHVPFLVRGPGIQAGSLRSQPVLNIDIAPTFLDIAGVWKPHHMDGISFKSSFQNPNKKYRDAFLIERGKMTHQIYRSSKDKNYANGKISFRDRLLVECKKPKYQPPCSKLKKWVCVNRNERLEIERCNKVVHSHCHCKPGDVFGWKSVSMKPRFSRSVNLVQSEDIFLGELTDLSNEIDELDDRNDFSRQLVNKTSVNIERQMSTRWVSSRNTVKMQIKHLRAQLNELKQIRKYLRITRPQSIVEQSKLMKSNLVDKSTTEVCLCDTKENKLAFKKRLNDEGRLKRRRRKLGKLQKRKLKKKKSKSTLMNKTRQDHCKVDIKMNCFRYAQLDNLCFNRVRQIMNFEN